MITFFQTENGDTGLRGVAGEIEGPIPDGATTVAFDGTTNPELVASLNGEGGFRWQDHAIAGGQIVRSGQPVAINPPRVLTDVEQLSAAVVAIALLTLDEINLLRGWITGFKAATAAATSLANLQARVAALPSVPDRTRAQLLNAVREKLTDI